MACGRRNQFKSGVMGRLGLDANLGWRMGHTSSEAGSLCVDAHSRHCFSNFRPRVLNARNFSRVLQEEWHYPSRSLTPGLTTGPTQRGN